MRSIVVRGVLVSLVLSWAVGRAQAAEVFTEGNAPAAGPILRGHRP